MKVYVVQLNHGCDNIENLGIFSTEEKAENFVSENGYRNSDLVVRGLVSVLITSIELDKAVMF